ncbi:hypothetical protein TTHERM_00142300 (macronuclear) [Tetrahymena thermophila SB210]|uniref:Uncharacterized protein n=1 Tax=Tetrahymena thermophila (strain SB210) TaxID=312017 RepID=I7MI31_TETTS|nr:hypothetical protein TTHERM_00142300 [Tetrahymena thermophila SB210]EAR90823.1 hypothetical protein TTHERM_00142300 [Tetrahymena thermophila SB210]|eukprot:XP_001011068.1 hypothetical protein TTHERM_00142300 [Tetrahymena thermophila SB210]
MGNNQSEIKQFIPQESTRYPFSLKFIISLERLINTKRNTLLKECNINSDHIYYLNAILDLNEIINKFEDMQQDENHQRKGCLKPQTIYDYLFTLNKIKLDLENFPKQFNSNKLYQQLYQFCSPINLNQFIDLFDINEIKSYVFKESNQQIKEYQFNSHFINPSDDARFAASAIPFNNYPYNQQQNLRNLRQNHYYLDYNRQFENQSISSQSTAFE